VRLHQAFERNKAMNSSGEYIQLAISSIESLYGTLDDGSIDFDSNLSKGQRR
jgi:hypothetical protein